MIEIYSNKNSVTREQIEESRQFEIDVPGIELELKEELEARIKEFEETHEWDALHGGNGWVNRIKKIDVLATLSITIILFLWWSVAISLN